MSDLSKEEKNSGLEVSIEKFKTWLQYGVGFYIFFFILLKTWVFLGIPLIDIIPWIDFKPVSYILSKGTLSLLSQAMMVSAAIELAYMLFTPGPDEAVEPLIIGIAGSALYVLSDYNDPLAGSTFLTDAAVILLFVLSMSILFYLRYKVKKWFPTEGKAGGKE